MAECAPSRMGSRHLGGDRGVGRALRASRRGSAGRLAPPRRDEARPPYLIRNIVPDW